MKSLLRKLGSYFPLMDFHPSSQELLAFCDGELTPHKRQRLIDHLSCCKDCRLEVSQIEDDLRLFGQVDQFELPIDPAQISSGLDQLRYAIRNWNAANLGFSSCFDTPIGRVLLQHKLRVELEIYLGEYATANLFTLASSTEGALREAQLISRAEPMLASFLGKKAGSDVIGRLWRLCDLYGHINEGDGMNSTARF